MPPIQRQGDSNSEGGEATGGVGSVRINGRAVVVDGTAVSAHAPWTDKQAHEPHSAASTTGGVGSVRAANTPINVDGNADTCGHARQGGSGTVRAG